MNLEHILQGTLLIYDKEHFKLNCCLICENPDFTKEVMSILQQPPEEYKEKYVACITSEEPKCVCEKEEKEEKDETLIEVEET